MLRRLTILAALSLAAAAAAAQEREWQLDSSDTEAYLTFGVPESDDVGLSFWCPLHSGRISLFVPDAGQDLKAGPPVKLVVQLGGKSFTYTGKTQANEESGGVSVEAELAAGDALFAAFKGQDRLSLTIAKEQQNFPLEGADAAGLVALCKV
jgi:hypothetical protein